MARPQRNQEPSEFHEKVVQVSRVSKKTKGGNKVGFSVLVVVGDQNGKVGVALGKGPDVLSSIKKAIRRAKKNMINVPLKNGTIPFPINIKHGAARIMLKPAPKGTGVIAGGAVRAVVEAAGVSNIVSKILGTNNKASNVYGTFEALKELKAIARMKGLKLDKPAPKKQEITGAKPFNKDASKKNRQSPKNNTSTKPNTVAKKATKAAPTKKVASKKK